MFLRNCWYVAASESELVGSEVVARRILGLPVVLFATKKGEFVALKDECPHRLVPLSAGVRQGDALRCGYHGMVFDASGQCVEIPGQGKIPANACVERYPTVARHSYVWIWMGESARADAALIPDVRWPVHEDWATAEGYTHVNADYRLLSDNLLDLTHENYIHEKTIGNESHEAIADYPVKVTVKEGPIVRAYREMPSITPPPLFQRMIQSQEKINRWQAALWTAPAINITDVGLYPIAENKEAAFVARVLHLLTPETENSTHYFWSHNRDFRIDDRELTEQIRNAHFTTFNEDKVMLEIQQSAILESKSPVPKIALGVDDAPLRARRYLSSALKKEELGKIAIAADLAIIPEDFAAA